MAIDDIRWKQRYQNFSRSFSHLREALAIENPDRVHKAGIIQMFEMTYELSWNLLKDYLEYQGYTDVRTPRAAIKQAFASELIAEGHMWIDLIQDRNLTSHTYNEAKANAVEQLVRHKYFPLFEKLSITFSAIHDN